MNRLMVDGWIKEWVNGRLVGRGKIIGLQFKEWVNGRLVGQGKIIGLHYDIT